MAIAEESAGADTSAPSAKDPEAPVAAVAAETSPNSDATHPTDADTGALATGAGSPADGVGAGAADAGTLAAPPPLTPKASASVRTWITEALVGVAAAAIPFLVMCADRRFRFSVPLGFVALLVSTFGILSALGTFKGEDARVLGSTSLRALRARLVEVVASIVLHLGVLTLAVSGVLPKPILTAAVLVPATFLWTVTAVYRLGHALGAFRNDDGTDPGLFQRPGFWLV
ncbi:MAG TPA: hypothetical protein VF395_03700, partial [Polyangiaceae bacterium]